MRYEPIFSNLRGKPPTGWKVVRSGAGVYLWPECLCEFKNQLYDPLLADWEILFEVFCLKNQVKITARALPAGPNFRCFLEAAEKSGLKTLKTGKAGSKTKAVAVWRLKQLGVNAVAIAEDVRAFLEEPPVSLKDFITTLESCCSKAKLSQLAASKVLAQTPLKSSHASKSMGSEVRSGIVVGSTLPLLPQVPPLRTQQRVTALDVIQAVVAWIQTDPFQRSQRINGAVRPVAGAPIVQGWDQRMIQYAYALNRTPITDFANVLGFRAQTAGAVNQIMGQPAAQRPRALSAWAQQICDWGAVPQRNYAPADAVVASAVKGAPVGGAPMNSGWTKVASFATDGMANAQTIWDSRVSTSVVWRIDSILTANSLPQNLVTNKFNLGIIPSRGAGLRPQRIAALRFRWANAYGRWDFHFGGSAVVREMVAILNDPVNNYPQMPLLGGGMGAWDVFGVGLVLFMDGY